MCHSMTHSREALPLDELGAGNSPGSHECAVDGTLRSSSLLTKGQLSGDENHTVPDFLTGANVTGALVFVNHALCRRVVSQILRDQSGKQRLSSSHVFRTVAQHGSEGQGVGCEPPAVHLSEYVMRSPEAYPENADHSLEEFEKVRNLEEEEHKRRLEEIERANDTVRASVSVGSKDARLRRSKKRAIHAVLARRKHRRMQVDVTSKKFDEFRQEETRNLKISHILFSPKPTAIFCSVWGLAILIIGIIIIFVSQKTRSVSVEYSSSVDRTLELQMEVEKKLEAPVHVYYKIENFFGNAKQYLRDGPKHISSNQRCSKIQSQKDALDLRTIDHRQTLPWLERDMFSGTQIPENQERTYPCGLQSLSIFNDEFTLLDAESKAITIRENELAVEWKFLPYVDQRREFEGISPWMATGSVRYRVWSEASFTPKFLKLYGIISTDLVPGSYKLRFSEAGWPAEAWDARKAIVFMSLSELGSSNVIFAWIVIGTGIACITLSMTLAACAFFKIRFPGSSVRQARLDNDSPIENIARAGDVARGSGTCQVVFQTSGQPPEETPTKLVDIAELAGTGFACVCPLHGRKEKTDSSPFESSPSPAENKLRLSCVSKKDELHRGEVSLESPDSLLSLKGEKVVHIDSP